MTEHCRRMLNDDESDLPEKCRERRRRRIEMRRVAALAAGERPPEPKRLRSEETNASSSTADDAAEQSEPVFGMISVAGRSRHMEDAVSVRTELCRPEICRRRSVHFFAVYDGHGGPHVYTIILYNHNPSA